MSRQNVIVRGKPTVIEWTTGLRLRQRCPAIAAATLVQAGTYVDVYRGRLAEHSGTVRFVALAPGVEDSVQSAFDAHTGARLWCFETQEQRQLSTPAVVDDTVYVASGLSVSQNTRQKPHESSVYALR